MPEKALNSLDMEDREILSILNRLSRHRQVCLELLKSMPGVFPEFAAKLVTANFNEDAETLSIEAVGSKFIGRVIVIGKEENKRMASDATLVFYYFKGEQEIELMRLVVEPDGGIKNPDQISGEYFAVKSFLEKICLGFELGI